MRPTLTDLADSLTKIQRLIQDLDKFGGVDRLSALAFQDLHEVEQFPQIAQAAKELFQLSTRVNRQMQEAASGDVQIVTSIPGSVAGFYEAHVRKRAFKIWKLNDLCNDFSLADLFGEEELETPEEGTDVQASMRLATHRTLEDLGDDPDFEEFAFGKADEVACKGYFTPDVWHRNEKDLAPILARSSPDSLAPQIRVRVRECYKSFLFGNYFASVSMCRATVEYAVKAFLLNAKADIMVMVEGERRERDLKSLIEIAHAHFVDKPHVRELMHQIRRCGNVVLHPAAGRNVCEFPTDRARALACIEALRKVMRELFV